jgi:hypothetical protein
MFKKLELITKAISKTNVDYFGSFSIYQIKKSDKVNYDEANNYAGTLRSNLVKTPIELYKFSQRGISTTILQ